MKEKKGWKNGINVGLIKKIVKHVEADKRRLMMAVWGVKKGTPEGREEGGQWPACGTKGCFAGWAVLLTTPQKKWPSLFSKRGLFKSSIEEDARKLLGFSFDQAEYVFYGNMGS